MRAELNGSQLTIISESQLESQVLLAKSGSVCHHCGQLKFDPPIMFVTGIKPCRIREKTREELVEEVAKLKDQVAGLQAAADQLQYDVYDLLDQID